MSQPLSLQPYLVATEALWDRVDRAPLGARLAESNWFDPTRVASRPLIDCLDRLDELTFAPLGMRMPRWALYDCAALPGAIFGLCATNEDAPHELMRALAPPTDARVVPLTMCLLTPRVDPGEWLAYSVSGLLDLVPGQDGREAEVRSLALALAVVGARRVLATTQWESQRLDVLARLAPLEVLAAHVPAHTHRTSFVCRVEVTRSRLEQALVGAPPVPEAARSVDASDLDGIAELARRIEAGAKVCVVGTTVSRGVLRALVTEEPR